MKLYVMFGHRQERYKGEYNPEPFFCWSEYEVEENPEGFATECAKARESRAAEFAAMKVFAIEVNEDAIVKQLLEAPTIQGKLVT